MSPPLSLSLSLCVCLSACLSVSLYRLVSEMLHYENIAFARVFTLQSDLIVNNDLRGNL